MSVWVVNAIIIEALALISVLGVWKTGRTNIAFGVGFNTMFPVTLVYILQAPVVNLRHLLILAMVLVYLAHMNWLLFFQSKRTAIQKLDAHLPLSQKIVLPAVLVNGVGWIYCLPFYFAARRPMPLNLADGLAVAVYVVGTIIHFGSDYQKVRFKQRPENTGQLLQHGFWRWCRHPNYFGDFLIYVAFALLGNSVWGWSAPVLNFLQYRFDAIPKNEAWARERYGEQWDRYAARVKMFVPFIY